MEKPEFTIFCPECGAEYEATEERCPDCGTNHRTGHFEKALREFEAQMMPANFAAWFAGA